MTKIAKDEVRHIAKLARLNLGDKEVEFFAEQLGAIISYIDKLKEVDTAGVEPTSHALSTENVFRKDTVKPSLDAGRVLKNAPQKEKNLFKVPRIIEDTKREA